MSGSHEPLLIFLGASVANAIGRVVVVSPIVDFPRPTLRKAMPHGSGMISHYEWEHGGLEWA